MKITPKLRKHGRGNYSVLIHVHDGGKYPIERPTVKGVKINKNDFNNDGNEHLKNWVKSSCKEYKLYNHLISEKITALQMKYLKASAQQIDEYRQEHKQINQTNFIEYSEIIIRNIYNGATRTNLTSGLRKFQKYIEENYDGNISYGHINKDFINRYYNWLLNKHSATSANQYFGTFRTLYNKAINGDDDKIKGKSDLFDNFRYQRNKTINEPLTEDELEAFKNLDCGKNRKWKIAKNIWLFQFSQALRVSDVILLKWVDIKFKNGTFILDNFTNKTSERIVRKLSLESLELFLYGIDRYYPHIIDEVNNINNKIKKHTTKIKEIENNGTPKINDGQLLEYVIQNNINSEQIRLLKEAAEIDKKNIKKLKKKIEKQIDKKINLFNDTLKSLRVKHNKEYIFDQANEKVIDRNKQDNATRKKKNSIISAYDGMLKRMAKAAGIETNMKSHASRYTASSLMYNSGVSMNHISEYLTHSNYKITEKYIKRLGLKNDSIGDFLNDRLK